MSLNVNPLLTQLEDRPDYRPNLERPPIKRERLKVDTAEYIINLSFATFCLLSLALMASPIIYIFL